MIWLTLSILSSASLLLFFKVFEKYRIDTFHAIVVNYFACVLVGLPLVNDFEINTDNGTGWIPLAMMLGTIFISLFFLIGQTTQKMGVSVATVSMKLGYIFPILLAFTVYNETITFIKITGIVLTLLAVVLTSIKKKENIQVSSSMMIILPAIIFFGSGLCDSVVQYTEKIYFKNGGFEMFNILIFTTAFLIGLTASIYKWKKNGKSGFDLKTIIGGMLLGIPNYFSIYFLFKALNVERFESSVVFPINNIGIVLTSTILSVMLFREKLSMLNLIGFSFAIVSIVIMSPVITEYILSLF
jgi:drug/metabolite transporter (DMT)-like permease